MNEVASKYTVIPCNEEVEVLFPYKDENNKIKLDRMPVIAWLITYHDSKYNNNNAYTTPICHDAIINLDDTILYYTKKETWIKEGFIIQDIKRFHNECEEIIKAQERRERLREQKEQYEHN